MDADLFTDDPAPPPPTGARAAWAAAQARWRRWRAQPWLHSLRLRLTLLLMVTLGAAVLGTGWQVRREAEHNLLRQAVLREAQEARHDAAGLGRRLRDLTLGLQTLSGELGLQAVPPDGSGIDTPRAQALIARQSLLRGVLGNLFVTDAQGRIVVHADDRGTLLSSMSVIDRPYFKALQAGQAVAMSQPLQGGLVGEPGMVIAVPIRVQGQLVGSVGGFLRLLTGDLMASLAYDQSTRSAAALVLLAGDGQILVHPQRAWVLAPVTRDAGLAAERERQAERRRAAATVADSAADPAADGVAGLEALRAGEDLRTAAPVPGTDWQLWRVLPSRVLLAPVREAQQAALRGMGMLAAVLLLSCGAYIAWQLRPLHQLEASAMRLLQGDADGHWPEGDDEVGRLARTLRHVWAERRQVEGFNEQVLGKLKSVLDAAPVGIAFSCGGRLELVSVEFCRLTGKTEADLIGHSGSFLFDDPDDVPRMLAQADPCLKRGEPYAGEWRMRHADGSVFWSALRARVVKHGEPAAGIIWSLNDISDQVASRQMLEHAARHDKLTGVANRHGFERTLEAQFVARPTSLPMALLMIDLDRFKPINDSAGHAAGDAMLQAVARAISATVRGTDGVARLGGDEFAVLLPHCDQERAMAVAEKIRRSVTGAVVAWEGRNLSVGASIGVASLGMQAESVAEWLAAADAACYEAKRSGRDRVCSAQRPKPPAEDAAAAFDHAPSDFMTL